MFFPSTIVVLSFCFVLTVLCLQSSSGAPSKSLTNVRIVRTTKFPRIGRSPFDSDETALIDDLNSSSTSEEKASSIDERSVLFPRIGKRAFHNLLWANALSNPHRMVDAQGRYYLNGYDYNVNPSRSQFQSRYRGKRNVQID